MPSNSNIRVRFAPSPTGYLHVGELVPLFSTTSLPKATGGKFILRIEDTDRTRYNEEALKELMADLKWLDLDWDEGPEKGGDKGPYTQSDRLDLYQKFAQSLVEAGKAYPCFCTSERLAKLRESQEKSKQKTGYDRACRDIPPEEAAKRVANGEKHTIRLKVPLDGITSFQDFIRGPIEYQNALLDDMILMKKQMAIQPIT